MKRSYSIIIVFVFIGFHLPAQSPENIIESAIEAMGGLEKWKNIAYIQSEQASHKYWLEQSEHPDGPYITSYNTTSEIRGVHSQELSVNRKTNQFVSSGLSQFQFRIKDHDALMQFGNRFFPMPYQLRINEDEQIRYAPDYLLFSALKEKSVLEGPITIDGVENYEVSFMKDGLKHQLFINAKNYTITMAQIETHLPYDIFNYPWGKFKTTIKYSIYWLYQNGIRYPAQWDVYKLGKPFLSITFLDLNFRPEIVKETFEIPDSLKSPEKKPQQLVNEIPLPIDKLVEVVPGLQMIPGMWNVGMIEQKDGIVVIEAPISSGYNKQHIDFIAKNYPNKPIKALISTSDAWPHVGGVREYIAQEIPIYTHFLNQEIINKISKSDHSLNPDALQKKSQTPIFNSVEKIVRIEDPEMPIQLLPINGEGGARMIAIYFPKQKVLYASDLLQYANRKSKTFFAPQYLSEVKALVDRHNLEVETVFAMHLTPTPWEDVLEALK